jgi:hypothetical protein
MNAVIWWLEAPWQIRASVFFLSFLACFVAPWLYNSGILATPSRRTVAPETEAKSTQKAEAPVQQKPAAQTETPVQAAVPAPREETQPQATAPVHEEETSVQAATPAPKEETQPQATAPVHEEEVPVQAAAPAPKEEIQPLAAASIHKEEAPAPVAAPVHKEEAPAAQEQAAAAASAHKEEKAPIPKADAPAQTPETVPQAEAPAQPLLPQAQAPAPQAAPVLAPEAAEKPAGEFKIESKGGAAISVPALGLVEKQLASVSTPGGGSAEVEVHILPKGSILPPAGRSAGRQADPSSFLDADAFAKAAASYDAVVCVGLGSRGGALSTEDILRLANNQAVQLCGVISRKPYVSKNTKLYGLPLAQDLDAAAAAAKAKSETSLLVVGIRSAKGDLADTAKQKRMVAEIIRGLKIENVSYAEAGSDYIEVKGGKHPFRNKPVKHKAVRMHAPSFWEDFEDAVAAESKIYKARRGAYRRSACGRPERGRAAVAVRPSRPQLSRPRPSLFNLLRRPAPHVSLKDQRCPLDLD